MKKVLCSIFDTKAQVFSNPFTSVNSLTALRSFSDAASDPHTEIHRNPTDYVLYEIGTFDDVLGVVMPSTPVNHGGPVMYRPVTNEDIKSFQEE